MKTIWHSLLWKEWHEHQWKLAALLAILLAVPLVLFLYSPEDAFTAVTSSIVGYSAVATLFLGMNLAAREKSRGTMPFLQALPAPLWKTAIVKLGAALLTSMIPIVALVSVVFVWHSLWGQLGIDYRVELTRFGWDETGSDWYMSHLVLPLFAIPSLLLWVAALGLKQQDEIRAGAVSVAVIFGIWLILGLTIDRCWQQADPPLPKPVEALIAAAPAGPAAMAAYRFDAADDGFFSVLTRGWLFWPTLAAIASHVWLVWRYLTRFGENKVRSARAKDVDAWDESSAAALAAPRRSPMTAIVWKQLRETVPIALLGAAAIVVLSVTMTLGGSWRNESSHFRYSLFQNVTQSWLLVGFLLSIVAGVGIMGNDLQPQLYTFWRSRPINVDQWFWVKFLTGLGIIIVALATPLVLLYGYCSWAYEDATLWGTHFFHPESPLTWGWVLHAMTYAGAVVAMCLVRQPLYAGIFAMAIWLAVLIAVEVAHFQPDSFVAVAGFGSALTAIAACTAWVAVRRDWGWSG